MLALYADICLTNLVKDKHESHRGCEVKDKADHHQHQGHTLRRLCVRQVQVIDCNLQDHPTEYVNTKAGKMDSHHSVVDMLLECAVLQELADPDQGNRKEYVRCQLH